MLGGIFFNPIYLFPILKRLYIIYLSHTLLLIHTQGLSRNLLSVSPKKWVLIFSTFCSPHCRRVWIRFIIYIYIYTHKRSHSHTHAHTRTHTHTHTHTHIYIYIYIYIYQIAEVFHKGFTDGIFKKTLKFSKRSFGWNLCEKLQVFYSFLKISFMRTLNPF